MAILFVSIILWIVILIFNTIYSFLPSSLQGILWIRICAILAASIILIFGIKDAAQDYKNYRFAYISAKDGKILQKKNFPWIVTKTKTSEGDIIYIINERYGDTSEISLTLDNPNDKYKIYNAIDGVGVKFSCADNEIPNFKIEIKK
ncbi:MAG: hypothetical protein PHT50_06485 [Candidatus Omnitrophica bacterium]|nr:hypothetical protein [Candidatus Omnitrophota bacterium]